MKILFLSPSASLGGAEQVLLTMTAMLREHVPSIDLNVLIFGDGPLAEALKKQHVNVLHLTVPLSLERLGDSQIGFVGKIRLFGKTLTAIPGLWRLRRDFRTVIRDLRPDLVHSNGIKTHLLASFAGTGGIPVIWHVHDFYGSRTVARRLLAWASRGMREAIAISQAVADDFRSVVGPRPVTLIPNAIDLSRFRPGRSDPSILDPVGQPVPPDTLRIGLVATYARWKGHEIFLRAAARILRELPKSPIRFYLIGGPVYRTSGSQYSENDLRCLARDLGISEKMQIICFQTEPERVYSSLDIVVHASTRPEPFGLTIVEAMACGRPVIASLAGGVGEIIDDGQNALGIQPGNLENLVDSLKQLIQDGDLRAKLSVNARSKAELSFDRNRIGPQLSAVYGKVLQV